VLQRLTIGDADKYDVTAEQANQARLYLALPLSALAPRMRYLERLFQDPDVSAPVVAGRIGVDAIQLFRQFDEALAAAGVTDRHVQAWPMAGRSLRSILPTIEGGLDKSVPPLWSAMRKALVPERAFPPVINKDMGILYGLMNQKFSKPFIDFYFDPQQPRELLLRGHFNEASRPLTALRKDTMEKRLRFEQNKEMRDRIPAALEALRPALADLQRAERQAGGDAGNPAVAEARERWGDAWKEHQPWLDALVDGAAAGPLGQEVNYQLALVKHEQALRMPLGADTPGPARRPRDDCGRRTARGAWQTAAEWWTTYLQDYGDAPFAPAARFQASQANLMLGERGVAINLLRDPSRLSPLEKLGRLIVARQ